jgi:hypothetical protein
MDTEVLLPESDRVAKLIEIIKRNGRISVEDVERFAEGLDLAMSGKQLRLKVTRTSKNVDWPAGADHVEWVQERVDQKIVAPIDIPKGYKELLDVWLKADDGERPKAELAIIDVLGQLDPESQESRIAAVFGIGPKLQFDWEKVPLDMDLSELAYEKVVERAIDAGAQTWLVAAAVRLSKKARTAAEVEIKSWAAIERSEQAASFLADLAESSRDRSCAQLLRNLGRIFNGDQTPLFLKAILRVVPAFLGSEASREDKERTCSELAALCVTADSTVLQEELNRSEISNTDLRNWLVHLASSNDPVRRVAMIYAIAASTKRNALFDGSVFAGFDLMQLGELFSADWARSETVQALAEAKRQAVQKSVGVELGPVITATAKWPVLEALLPLELLQRLAQRDNSDGRLLRAIAQPFIETELSSRSEAFTFDRENLSSHIAHAEAQAALKSEQLEQARGEIQKLETQIRERRIQQTELRESEIRQARIDVLRSFTISVRAIRDSLVPLGDPALLSEAVKRSEQMLRGFDVEVLGEVGSIEGYNPQIHEAADISSGAPVEILAPAYRVMNTETPLLYAQVREVP